METQKLTIILAIKGGAIAGLIGVGLNNIWSLIAAALGTTIPPGFAIAVTLSSFVPVLIGALIFFVLVRYASKGKIIWYALSIGFMLFSFFPVFNTPQLPDGTLLDSTFPLLAGPMHVISGFLTAWGIPKWSR
ncbi:MAG: hypothetical protein ORN54_10565 [Cyclobacteriaceae bacterium]|nr:hypothetical protein [Cyclobacteriaceae bacterium]